MCACALIRKKWLSSVNIVKSLELVFIFKCGHSLHLNLYAQGSRQQGGWGAEGPSDFVELNVNGTGGLEKSGQ